MFLSSRVHRFTVLITTLLAATAISHAAPVTLAAVTGIWELRTACMYNKGKPGFCIEMKPGTLLFTFSSDGKWSSAANDVKKTKGAGTYQINGRRLTLKNSDGSPYQDWQPDLSDDGKHFVIIDKQLMETFDQVKTAEAPLE